MKNLIIAFFITCMIFIQLNAQNRCDKACLKELSNGVDFIQFIYNPLTMISSKQQVLNKCSLLSHSLKC